MLASAHSHSSCVQMLLQHEAKPDATEIRGDTALIAAVQRGQVSC